MGMLEGGSVEAICRSGRNPTACWLVIGVLAAATIAMAGDEAVTTARDAAAGTGRDRCILKDDFEKGTEGWSPECRTIRIEAVTLEGKEGKCLRVTGGEEEAWVLVSRAPFPVQPGRKYVVSARVFVKEVMPLHPMGLRVSFLDRDNNKAGGANGNRYSLSKGGWQKLVAQYACPPHAVSARIQVPIKRRDGLMKRIEAYVDDVRVLEMDEFRDPSLDLPETAEAGRPRLFFTKSDISALKAKAKSPHCARDYEAIAKTASRALDLEPVAGDKYIDSSRKVLGIIPPCAFMYVMTGDKKYAERAKKEMLNVIEWKAWSGGRYKKSSLMTGETCLAIGCGYDWLYDYLTPEEREKIREAMVRLGIRPYLENIRPRTSWAGWQPLNWTSVVDGGVGVGALAVYNESAEAGTALAYARSHIRRLLCLTPEGPWDADGGYDEGVMYWAYGTRYLVLFASALKSALGTDDALLDGDPVRRSIWFPIYCQGPDRIIANFSDSYYIDWSRNHGSDFAGLFASLFNTPEQEPERKVCLWWAARKVGGSPFPFIWRPDEPAPAAPPALERAKLFSGIGWAVLRSEPSFDPGVYLAFKSGDLAANHTNYDLNSFILVAHGERLTYDPGYGHLKTDLHSTITVNGKGQRVGRRGRILRCGEGKGYLYVLGDASDAYGKDLTRFRRHVVLVGDGRSIVMVDELAASRPSRFEWRLCTNHPKAHRSKIKGGLKSIQVDEDTRYLALNHQEVRLGVQSLLPEKVSINVPRNRKSGYGMVNIHNTDRQTGALFVTALFPQRRDEGEASASAEVKGNRLLVRTSSRGKTDQVAFSVAPTGECALLGVNNSNDGLHVGRLDTSAR
jgi:hypothetical protein